MRDNRGKQKNADDISELEKLRAEVKISRIEKNALRRSLFLKKFGKREERIQA